MKKIVLAEAHPLLCAGLRHMLDSLPVTATVVCMDPATLDTFMYLQQDVDLLIFGASAEPPIAVAALRMAVERLRPRRVLVLCAPNPGWSDAAVQYSPLAYGCLPNNAPAQTLATAIALGLDTTSVALAPPEQEPASASVAQPPPPGNEAQMLGLTPRQYAVLCKLHRGLSIKEIARDLGITPATAKAHTATLYLRLGVRGKGAAVYAARQRGASLQD